jgi:hypothetical protein
MGAKAALAAMEQAGIKGDEIDLILVATATTPDMVFPATACFVQTKIGAAKRPASTSRPPALDSSSRLKSRSNSSPATPMTPCL